MKALEVIFGLISFVVGGAIAVVACVAMIAAFAFAVAIIIAIGYGFLSLFFA